MPSLDSSAAKTPHFILRFVEFILSILVFALVADLSDYDGSTGSKIDFVLFTGVTAFLICLTFMVLYLLSLRENSIVTLVELVINLIWWVFWLAAASCLADLIGDFKKGSNKEKVEASCAFAWILFFVWSAHCFLNIKEVMHGRGISSAGGREPGESSIV